MTCQRVGVKLLILTLYLNQLLYPNNNHHHQVGKWNGANDQNCSDRYEIFQSFIYMYFQVYPNPGT